MRAIGCLQFGHGNGRSGTLLSQLDEPICFNVLRQAKQTKWTLLVAVGTPDPFRIPATVVSHSAAKEPLHAAARIDSGIGVHFREACAGRSHSGDRSGQVQLCLLLVRHGVRAPCVCRESARKTAPLPKSFDVLSNRSDDAPTDQQNLSPSAVRLLTDRGHICVRHFRCSVKTPDLNAVKLRHLTDRNENSGYTGSCPGYLACQWMNESALT